jgi:hypothetical protein
MSTLAPTPVETASRPSALRRSALALTGVAAGALPLAWGISSLVQLVTGAEPEHRFHQLTGQGVLLAVLWLGALLPLLVAGWRGRRPAPAAAVAHVALVVGVVIAGLLAPGNGGLLLAGIVVVTGGLIWLALPVRPGRPAARLDPLLAPAALAAAALYAPFVIDQAARQRAFADEHARMSHYFDMAWLGTLVVLLLVAAALIPAARRLALAAGASSVVIGLARLVFTSDGTWSWLAAAVGVVAVGAALASAARGAN